ncbi:hypothetical protein D3C76_1617060 [compost metagenome]
MNFQAGEFRKLGKCFTLDCLDLALEFGFAPIVVPGLAPLIFLGLFAEIGSAQCVGEIRQRDQGMPFNTFAKTGFLCGSFSFCLFNTP